MGGLFKNNNISNTAPIINAVQYQQSTYGASKAVVYGTNRLTGNIIDCIDFTAIPHTTVTHTGKGGTTTSDTTYTYTANTLIGLCYGQIQGINRVILSNTNYSTTSLSMNVFNGSNTQLPWGLMLTNHPDHALCYRNMAYVAGTINLDANGAIPQYSFEVNGLYTNNTQDMGNTITEGFNFTTTTGTLGATNQAILNYPLYYVSDNTVTVNYQDAYGNQYTANNYTNYTKTSTGGIYTYNFNLSNLGAVAAHVYVTYNSTCRLDSNPKDIITDILTNQLYGAGLSYSYLADFTNYSNYCISNNLFLSPVYNSQDQADTVLTDLANITNSSYVWSQGKLNIVPIGDEVCSANGVTYTPNLQPIYNLTFDDFKSDNEPILWTRAQQTDVYNDIKLEYLDRGNNYNIAIAESIDQTNVQMYGWKPASTITAHQICTKEIAHQVSQMILDRYISVRNTCTFTINMKYILLEPMDLVTVPTKSGDTVLVRILTIKENAGWLQITAEEVVEGTTQPALIQPQSSSFTSVSKNAGVGDVNPPVIFEPPYDLTQGADTVWLGVSNPNNFFGGAQVWISDDGETYTLKNSINKSIRQGILTSTLPTSSSNPDGTNILNVDVSMSNATLLSGTQADADNLNTLCYVDGELLAYETATLTNIDKYSLSYLNRGAYGTPITNHNAGTQFTRIDADSFLSIPFNQADIGKNIYIKLCSFNVFNAGYQSLADVQPYNYVIKGTALLEAPEDVENITTYYQNGNVYLKWDTVKDSRKIQYEIRQGASWENSLLITQCIDTNCIVRGNGNYFVKALVLGANVYSQNAAFIEIDGARVPENVVANFDESATGWKGTLNNCYATSEGVLRGLNLVNNGNLSGGSSSTHPTTVISAGSSASTPVDLIRAGDSTQEDIDPTIYYEIPSKHVVNIGKPQLCNVSCNYNIAADNTADNFDLIPNIDLIANIDGNYSGYIDGSQLLVNLAQADGVWQDWKPFNQSQYLFQRIKFKAILESTSTSITPMLVDLNTMVDVPDLVQNGNITVYANTFTTITYATPYQSIVTINPTLQVSILNAQAGDYINVISQSITGFTIQCYNNNTPVTRTISWLAVGY